MKFPSVAANFKEALSDKKMTQQELANRSGIGKSSISHYCNGSHCPDNLRAIKLASILEVSPLWLMGLSEAKDPEPDKDVMTFYRQYTQAPAEIQAAVRTLLKSAQPAPELPPKPEDKA